MATITETKTIQWKGASGTEYKYWIHPIGTDFQDKPGNYVFARLLENGKYHAIYIGETEHLNERFEYHHKRDCIRRNGATHVCVHTTDGGAALRRKEEKDLIDNYNPKCNG